MLLVLFRVAGILTAVPFFGLTQRFSWAVMALSFPITLIVCTALPSEWTGAAQSLQTPGALVLAILGEVLFGAAIGLICGIFIGIFVVAGTIAGFGASLRMAQELNPISGEQDSLLGSMWRMLFLITVVVTNGHLALIQVVFYSFETIPPPWTGWMDVGADFAYLASICFDAGLNLALPVMAVSLLVSICMALMARMAQEFNVLFLSLPIRLLAALFVTGLTMTLSSGMISRTAHDMLFACYEFVQQ